MESKLPVLNVYLSNRPIHISPEYPVEYNGLVLATIPRCTRTSRVAVLTYSYKFPIIEIQKENQTIKLKNTPNHKLARSIVRRYFPD